MCFLFANKRTHVPEATKKKTPVGKKETEKPVVKKPTTKKVKSKPALKKTKKY